MLQMKVRFLPPSELDNAAAELLRRYSKWKGVEAKPPINVDEIVEGYLKLDFALTDLKTLLGVPDVLGATWFDEKRIRVDQSLEGKEGRYSFTLAHEVGHWQLHRPQYEMEKVTLPLFKTDSDKPQAPAVVCRSSEKKAPAEWQADQFAARILMPERAVKAAVRELSGDSRPAIDAAHETSTGRPNEALKSFAASVLAQGHFTNVSNEAMRIRLVELKLVGVASQTSL